MTPVAPTPASPDGNSRGHRPPWRPTYTEQEALDRGISTELFHQVMPWVRSVVRFHEQRGTERHAWEPTSDQIDDLTSPIIGEGQAVLEERLVADADPVIDKASEHLDDAKRALDDAAQRPTPVRNPESNTTYSGADAVKKVEKSSEAIEYDFSVGKHHHALTPWGWLTASKWAPFAEFLGLLVFCAFFLDVPILTPWRDWAAWTLAFSIVVLCTVGQMILVHYAAKNHNQAREAGAAGNLREAKAAAKRRNTFLVGAFVISIAIVGGMIERGLSSLGNSDALVYIILLSLATLAGLAMPVLAFVPPALNGSFVSREVAALSDQLDVDIDSQDAEKANVRANLGWITSLKSRLDHDILPSIRAHVQSVIDEAYPVLTFGRAQIGELTADPPPKGRENMVPSAVQLIDGELTADPSPKGRENMVPSAVQLIDGELTADPPPKGRENMVPSAVQLIDGELTADPPPKGRENMVPSAVQLIDGELTADPPPKGRENMVPSAVQLIDGELTADPPPKRRENMVPSAELIDGELSIGIDGARSVSLLPMRHRAERMDHIYYQAEHLTSRLEELPPHPWSMSEGKVWRPR